MCRGVVSPVLPGRAASRLACALLGIMLAHGASADTLYNVTINTTSVAGMGGTLAFDFIDGGPPSNQVTISKLQSDGTFGASATTGSVSGSALTSFTLSDSVFFSELVQGLTLGDQVSFQLDATTNAPAAGSLSDTLSFFLLDGTGVMDPMTAASLITTTDPTQANSLFTLQIDGTSGGNVTIFGASPKVPVSFRAVTGVAEPAPLALLSLALGVFASWRHPGRRRPSLGRGNT
jgi:hypothetical protein